MSNEETNPLAVSSTESTTRHRTNSGICSSSDASETSQKNDGIEMHDSQIGPAELKEAPCAAEGSASVSYKVCHWIKDFLPLLFSVGFIVLGVMAKFLDGKNPTFRSLEVVDEVIKYVFSLLGYSDRREQPYGLLHSPPLQSSHSRSWRHLLRKRLKRTRDSRRSLNLFLGALACQIPFFLSFDGGSSTALYGYWSSSGL